MMPRSDWDVNLSLLRKFQSHVPRILIKQLVSELVLKYGIGQLDSDRTETSSLSCCAPSIRRFYGALLFVDISGFTKLSQSLTVDKLRIQINSYFTKILQIVFKHKGDVIKFAGDALYVAWPVTISGDGELFPQFTSSVHDSLGFSASDSSMKNQHSREAVETATTCGLEVIRVCGNVKINLAESKLSETHIASMLMMDLPDYRPSPKSVSSRDSDSKRSSSAFESADNNVAYLNVHCGASIGTMAGLDVGAEDRWEYFIVGGPVADVAIAESEASQGEMVISPVAHALLHGDVQTGLQDSSGSSSPLPSYSCGCSRLACGYFRVGRGRSAPVSPEQGIALAQLDDSDEGYSDSEDDHECLGELRRSASEDEEAGEDAVELQACIDAAFAALEGRRNCGEAVASHPITSAELHREWVEGCLLEDVFRHVHEADRTQYTLQGCSRAGDASASMSRNSVSSVSAAPSGSKVRRLRKGSSMYNLLAVEDVHTASPCRLVENRDRSQSSPRGSIPRQLSRSHSSSYSMISLHDTTLVGELRTVATLFIKVHMPVGVGLLVDTDRDTAGAKKFPSCMVDSFHFLPRTDREVAADSLLLDTYQSCMEVAVRTLHSRGGQLRQFIVDDKGTVCIGTFGLRGSTTDDNAAAAIDTASEIQQKLADLGMQTSTGITYGKTYCGLVGSERRHEYAVMSPATNFCARLMCMARPGEILCGSEVRRTDRSHSFIPLGELVAKGFTTKVPTFHPVFAAPKAVCGRPLIQESPSRFDNLACFGREAELDKMFRILLPRCAVERDSCSADAQDVSSECSASSSPASKEVMFEASLPTTVLVVSGPHGIGKSTLLGAFDRQVSTLQLVHRARCNVSVFHNPFGSASTTEPLSAWIPVVCQMIHNLTLYHSGEQGSGERGADDYSEYMRSLDLLLADLSAELREMKPLLADVGIIDAEGENQWTAKVVKGARMATIADMIGAMVVAFSKRTGRRVLVIFDEIHKTDTASLDLVHKLWSARDAAEAPGISILLSYRPYLYRTALTDPSANFLQQFAGGERFQDLSVRPLDLPAIRGLIGVVLSSCGLGGVLDLVAARLFHRSAGNPLYAYELAKTIAEKYLNMTSSKSNGSGSSPDFTDSEPNPKLLADILSGFESSRIEQVISYRFDQLEPAVQLLLKMAAVACVHGGTFTLNMLVYVTMHYQKEQQRVEDSALLGDAALPVVNSGPSSSSSLYVLHEEQVRENVYALFQAILARNEFVQVIEQPLSSIRGADSGSASEDYEQSEDDAHSPHKESSGLDRSSSWVGCAHFQFSVDLELHAVYGLLLNNQHRLLHKFVALYLQSSCVGYEKAASEWYSEGQHWDSAGAWSTAMDCYLRSAMLLDAAGCYADSRRHLVSAHYMLDQMREAAGVPSRKQLLVTNSFHIALEDREDKCGGGGDLLPGKAATGSAKSASGSEQTLTKHDVFNICEGDNNVLHNAVNVCLKLAGNSMMASLDADIIAHLYGQASEMVSVATVGKARSSSQDSNDTEGAGSYASSPRLPRRKTSRGSSRSSSLGSSASGTPRGSPRDSELKFQAFGIADPSEFCTILTGINFMYTCQLLPDDSSHSKQTVLLERGLAVAKTSPYRALEITFQALQHRVLVFCGRRDRALQLAGEIRQTYSFNRQHRQIVRMLECDHYPQLLVFHSRYLLHMGRIAEAAEWMDEYRALLPRITDFYTLMASVAYFAPTMALFVSPRIAVEAHRVLAESAEAAVGKANHFATIASLVVFHLQMLVVFEDSEPGADGLGEGALQPAVAAALQTLWRSAEGREVVDTVLSLGYIAKKNEVQRYAMTFVYMQLTGTGVQFMCAEICLRRAQMLLRDHDSNSDMGTDYMDEAVQLLRVAETYISNSVTQSEAGDFFTCSLVSSLLLKAQIVCLLKRCRSMRGVDEDEMEPEREEEMDRQAEEARLCLQRAVVITGPHEVPLLDLRVATLLVELGVDEERGRQLQADALSRIRAANGGGGAGLEKWPKMVRIMPVLKDL